MAKTASPKTYLWCQGCRRSYAHADAPTGACPVCAAPMREIGRFAAIARGFMANELSASPLEAKHRQLIRLIWTRNGMGERYYRVLAPDMPYNRFEARVTGLLARGAVEGWVRFVLPAAPSAVNNSRAAQSVAWSAIIKPSKIGKFCRYSIPIMR